MQYCRKPTQSIIKKGLLASTLIFTIGQLQAQVFPVDTLMRNGNRANRVNIAYLSDGYQSTELTKFVTNVGTINTALFSQSPFKEYRNFFNSFIIKVPSTQSGAIHPRTASDEASSNGQPIANPTNYFTSTFDYAGIHRLIVATNYTKVMNVLSSNLPDYDQAFVIVNSTYYGGSGGAFATLTTDANSSEVAIHEVGHSFAGLADEYWAGANYAAEKPNLTQNKNKGTNRWKSWLGIRNIGMYNHVEDTTWVRPHQNCKMRYLNFPFCAVCSQNFIDKIHSLVNMIDTYTPNKTSFTLTDTLPVALSITNIAIVPNTVHIYWYLNNATTPFAKDKASVNIPFKTFIAGNNTVRVDVVDSTNLSKSYLPALGYVNAKTWTINKPVGLPINLKYFSGTLINTKATISWEVANQNEIKSFQLEKSVNGDKFLPITTLNVEENKTQYQYDDVRFLSSAYYRLRIIEKTGLSNYSNNIFLKNSLEKFDYKVFQNASEHLYHLSIALAEAQKVVSNITDLSGKRILHKDFGTIATKLDYDFNLPSIANGIYFLQLIIGEKNFTVKLVAN